MSIGYSPKEKAPDFSEALGCDEFVRLEFIGDLFRL